MQYFNIFAEDFELMKAKLSSDEIVSIFSALSELCLWGECEYTPQTPKQKYFWDKLKSKLDKDLSSYNASVINGQKGGRPKKETQNITQTETQSITQTETQNITQTETNLKPKTLEHKTLKPEIRKTYSSDKSSEYAKRKKLVSDDWVPKKETVVKLNEKGLDAEKTVEKFINSCRAKNLKYIDFDRAILSWDWSKDASVKVNNDEYDWI